MANKNLALLRDKLRSDKRSQRLMGLFTELPVYQLPLDKFIVEIEQIHKTRSIRQLTQSSPRFIEALVDASILDQSNRSRLAEISMACYRAEHSLKEALEPLKAYLLMNYSVELSGIRTKDERDKVLDMALAPFRKFINRTTEVREMCRIVIEDIDKGAWSLKLNVAAMQLKNGRGEQSL